MYDVDGPARDLRQLAKMPPNKARLLQCNKPSPGPCPNTTIVLPLGYRVESLLQNRVVRNLGVAMRGRVIFMPTPLFVLYGKSLTKYTRRTNDCTAHGYLGVPSPGVHELAQRV
jgi:hypothetical protein